MKKKKLQRMAMTVVVAVMLLAGCSGKGSTDAGESGSQSIAVDAENAQDSTETYREENVTTVELDPADPVILTVWHYYNGAQQAAFDELVSEFNAGKGKEEGIYIEGYSLGSVSDLEKAITESAAGKVGSRAMPDLFSTYADTAYALKKQGKLVDLTRYFGQEELRQYVDSYVQEGNFDDDGGLYLFPVVKATEIMMINKTDWEPFAQAMGVTTDDLSTTEGIVSVAEKYYRWTDALTPEIPDDGKAFYGRDSMSNYFIIGMKQMGTDLFSVENGEVTIRADKDKIRRLWDNYYVPYVNGYFLSAGKFRSDDVKTGEIVAYTGSTASAMYFPDQVEDAAGSSKEVEYLILPAPVMEGGGDVQVQQGAGMAVASSDAVREYASCEFLRWFTAKENNLRFVCDAAYLPVRKDSNSIEALDQVIRENEIEINSKAYDCLKSIMEDSREITYYTPKCFSNGYATRKVLDYILSDKAIADKAAIDEAVAAGASREEAVAPYITDEAFESWYDSFVQALQEQANVKG